jgi:hypothetical protein
MMYFFDSFSLRLLSDRVGCRAPVPYRFALHSQVIVLSRRRRAAMRELEQPIPEQPACPIESHFSSKTTHRPMPAQNK